MCSSEWLLRKILQDLSRNSWDRVLCKVIATISEEGKTFQYFLMFITYLVCYVKYLRVLS